MQNRLIDVQISPHRLDPAETELRLLVTPQFVTRATRIQGRLVGPRSLFQSTVEIAYPFRELARTEHDILLRIVIPESSFWDPETPFMYDGPLELWQDESMVEKRRLSHGLRHLRTAWPGLKVNGQRRCLRGVERDSLDDAEAPLLRQRKIDLIVSRKIQPSLHLWETANRHGFLVIGEGFCDPLNREVQRQPSALGRFVPEEESSPGPTFWGFDGPGVSIPHQTRFVLCDSSPTPAGLLRLERVDRFPEPPVATDGVLGWLLRE